MEHLWTAMKHQCNTYETIRCIYSLYFYLYISLVVSIGCFYMLLLYVIRFVVLLYKTNNINYLWINVTEWISMNEDQWMNINEWISIIEDQWINVDEWKLCMMIVYWWFMLDNWWLGNWWLMIDDWWLVIHDWWVMIYNWWLVFAAYCLVIGWLMIDGWCFMIDEWWLIIDDSCLVIDEWWLMLYD